MDAELLVAVLQPLNFYIIAYSRGEGEGSFHVADAIGHAFLNRRLLPSPE